MFVRSKVVKGQVYYQLIEGYREGGKVRHRTLASLGRSPTLADAIAAEKARLDAMGEPGSDRLDRLESLARGVTPTVDTTRPVKARRKATVDTTIGGVSDATLARHRHELAWLMRDIIRMANSGRHRYSQAALQAMGERVVPLEGRLLDPASDPVVSTVKGRKGRYPAHRFPLDASNMRRELADSRLNLASLLDFLASETAKGRTEVSLSHICSVASRVWMVAEKFGHD